MEQMSKYISEGYKIYYVEGQDKFNDLCFKGKFTNALAQQLPMAKQQ